MEGIDRKSRLSAVEYEEVSKCCTAVRESSDSIRRVVGDPPAVVPPSNTAAPLKFVNPAAAAMNNGSSNAVTSHYSASTSDIENVVLRDENASLRQNNSNARKNVHSATNDSATLYADVDFTTIAGLTSSENLYENLPYSVKSAEAKRAFLTIDTASLGDADSHSSNNSVDSQGTVISAASEPVTGLLLKVGSPNRSKPSAPQVAPKPNSLQGSNSNITTSPKVIPVAPPTLPKPMSKKYPVKPPASSQYSGFPSDFGRLIHATNVDDLESTLDSQLSGGNTATSNGATGILYASPQKPPKTCAAAAVPMSTVAPSAGPLSSSRYGRNDPFQVRPMPSEDSKDVSESIKQRQNNIIASNGKYPIEMNGGGAGFTFDSLGRGGRAPRGGAGGAPIATDEIAEKNRSPSPSSRQNGQTNGHGYTAASASSRSANLPSGKPTANHVVDGYVGVADISNQVYRKAMKRGFEFTLMVVGHSGLGKSTFVNSLFLADVYPDTNSVVFAPESKQTFHIEEHFYHLNEKGVNLKFTLVDTPGFGDAINNENCWNPILEYIDCKNEEYFAEECKVNRKAIIPDRRVHCCLYFIGPNGHGLKPLDIEVMKRLHTKVNIVPVIAKADTLTQEELTRFKSVILNEIQQHQIKIFDFADSENEEIEKWKARVPFAIIGSNVVQTTNGKKTRCRKYAWGMVEVENLDHNDFLALRNLVVQNFMIDLMEVTRNLHYERFRGEKMYGLESDIMPVSDVTAKSQATTEESIMKKLENVMQDKEKRLAEFKQTLVEEKRTKTRELDDKTTRLAMEKEAFSQLKNGFEQQHPDFKKFLAKFDQSPIVALSHDKSPKADTISIDSSQSRKSRTNTLGSMFRSQHQ